jgi:anti-sigma factor RsiW
VLHEQAAAFALDALDADESSEFEHHLEGCPVCQDAVEPLRFAAASLAFAGELPPPRAELRGRVLALDAVVLQFRRRWTAPLVSAATLAACAALVLGLTERSGSRGVSLLVDGSRGATLVTHGLPTAPVGKVYEIWILRAGRPTPAGFLHGRTGRLSRPLPPGAAVAVTLEPAGGSRRPTGPLLLRTETA